MNDTQWQINKKLQIAKDTKLTDFDKRHLDNAFNAISSNELSHVVSNTQSQAVLNYAKLKLDFFKTKGL